MIPSTRVTYWQSDHTSSKFAWNGDKSEAEIFHSLRYILYNDKCHVKISQCAIKATGIGWLLFTSNVKVWKIILFAWL